MSTDHAVVSVSEDPICYWKEISARVRLCCWRSWCLSSSSPPLPFSLSGALAWPSQFLVPLLLNMETERPKNHSFCHSCPAVMKVIGLLLQPRSTTSKNGFTELRTDSSKVLLRNPLICNYLLGLNNLQFLQDGTVSLDPGLMELVIYWNSPGVMKSHK